jgi:hypothetical protein
VVNGVVRHARDQSSETHLSLTWWEWESTMRTRDSRDPFDPAFEINRI